MRWKGFITLVVLLAVGLVVSVLFMDQWIETGLEKTGQAVVGARVEIDNLDFRLLDLSLEWDRLQVTDPKNTMQNIVETGRAAFNLHSSAFLRKRFIVEEMTLAGVRSGTPRTYDGALPKRKPSRIETGPSMLDKVKAKLQMEIDQLPVMRFDAKTLKRKVNVDSLIVVTDLKVVDRVDSVKKDVIQTAEEWEIFYEEFHPEEDLQKIRADFTGLDPKQIQTVSELLAVLEKVQSVRERLSALSRTVDEKTREVREDFDRVGSYRKSVNQWVEEDYQRLLRKAKLPDLGARNIGKVLFGPAMVYQVSKYLDYLRIIRRIIPEKRDKPEKEKRLRMKGQTVRFPDRHGWPAFLIQKIHLSGQTGAPEEKPGLVMQGEARGITSQPWIYGRPTTVDLRGVREDQRAAVFNAVLNHTTESSSDSFNLVIMNVPLGKISIPTIPYLPSDIREGRADFTGITRIQGGNLLLRFDIQIRGMTFDFTALQTEDVFVKAVQDVIHGVDQITLRTEIFSRGDDLSFRIRSNLDALVSEKLKRVGSQALMETRNQIRSRLDKISSEKVAELDDVFSVKERETEGRVDETKKQVDELSFRMESKIKEITEDIGQRRQFELEEKAKKLLESILNKDS